MPDQPEQIPAPAAFGIDSLTRLCKQMSEDMRAGFHRLERAVHQMADQLGDMDAKLQNIADTETKLGTDIQMVVDALKAIPNPPQDLTAQLMKLDQIAQTLIDTDAQALSNLPPAPNPAPTRRR